MKQHRLHAITVARFVAAFAVLVFHILPNWVPGFNLESPSLMEKVTLTGYSFVSFFYLLSGFVIQYTYGSEPLAPGIFWKKRFARLAPVFYFSLLIGIVPAIPALQSMGELYWLPFYLLVSVLFIGSFFPACQILNYPSWSIHVEAFFYLFYPALHSLQFSKTNRFFKIALLLVAANWILIGLCFYLVPALWQWNGINQGKPILVGWENWLMQFIHTNPIAHISEFILGVILGKFHQTGFRISRFFSGWLLAICGGVFLILVSQAASIPYLILNSFGLSPLFLITILALANIEWNPPKFLVLLGEASYSLYILHVPLRDWASAIRNRAFSGIDPVLYSILVILACIFASILAYQWIERPLQKKILQRRSPNTSP